MGETNCRSVAHVGCDISPFLRVEKYRNPWATEGESICTMDFINLIKCI